jgi:hypothetical protein
VKIFLLAITVAALLPASEIRMEKAGGGYYFRVINAAGNGDFTVTVDQPGAPPMLGSVAKQGHDLQFTPRFPLTPGMKYRAIWNPAPGKPQTALFEIPKPFAAPSTVVASIFPSFGKLPENQLKIYIHFSAPMAKGEAYRHIHLLNNQNKEVELAFLELDEELWDREGKRITLLFDPGRIKRGVLPLAEVGGALKPGETYRLVVDSSWLDAIGLPLARGMEKHFTVVEADRVSPNVASWKVTAPTTSEPLTILFPEPMDEALLHRMILVRAANGKEIPGEVKVSQQETRWTFQPAMAWTSGNYLVEVDTALEDLAGNKIGRLFDVDVFEKVDRTIRTTKVTIPFTVQ